MPNRGALRVLLANERVDHLERMAALVAGLGHDVVRRERNVSLVGAATQEEQPDVAIVGLGPVSQHALSLIDEIVLTSVCPVIALVDVRDTGFVTEAGKHGVFAFIDIAQNSDDVRASIDITLLRFAEYRGLKGAFGRRAVIEQAKGVLMARHGVGPDKAFQLLRTHSRSSGAKLVDVAQAVLDSHLLLQPPPR